jgi:hypothetical protein
MEDELTAFDSQLIDAPLFDVTPAKIRAVKGSREPSDEQVAAGDSNLYGVYGSKEVDFDSDQTIAQTGLVANPSLIVQSAEQLLQLAVGDRKVLLKSEINNLPTSFRMKCATGTREQDISRIQGTRCLVDDIISGRAFNTDSEAAQEMESMRSGRFAEKLRRRCDELCGVTSSLVDALHS